LCVFKQKSRDLDLFTLWLRAESSLLIASDVAIILKLQMLYAPFLKIAFLNSYLKQELYVGGPFEQLNGNESIEKCCFGFIGKL
jgi:hypothetical protein